MQHLKKIIAGLLVVAIAALTGHFTGTTTVIEQKVVGALSGPDISSPYLNWGNLSTFNARQALTTATSTPCSIQSPTSTSTLVATTFQVTTATSTAVTLVAATSTTAFATTTLLTSGALASGTQGSLAFNATSSGVTNNVPVMAPNTWVVWSVAGFVPAGTTLFLGTCSAQFRVL